MREIQRIIVGAYIKSSDGYIAFGKKHPGPQGVYSNDCWHIPGGGLESGESHLEGLIREVLEEIRLDITPYPCTLLDDVGTGSSTKVLATREEVLCHMQFFVYHVSLPMLSTDISLPKETDEFADIKWVHKSDIRNLKLTPPGKELLERISL
jgi:8-oxo-dGTP pyrophosphatase MutT (NUDIX family)